MKHHETSARARAWVRMREMMMARLAQMNLVRKRHGAGPVVHRHPEDPDGVCDGLHSTIPDPKNPGAYIDIGGG